MHIIATDLKFLDDVKLQLTFQDGNIIQYDMSLMFQKYPQLKLLREDRDLFLKGHLDPGGYSVIWNEDLDFDATSIYEDGILVGKKETTINQKIGILLTKAREEQNITQSELSKKTHIDQGDISKIEKGIGNPTILKLTRLFNALGKTITLNINE